METSIDDKFLFAGGSSEFDLKKGTAQLYALSFDENLKKISHLELKSGSILTMGVSKIKRISDRDVLYVGTNSCLFVVEWKHYKFSILNHVEQIHSCKFKTLSI